MIRVDINEIFPIVASVIDENSSQLIPNQTVYYEIRDINDQILSPPASGILPESSVEVGIYRTYTSIPANGSYICYCTASGFVVGSEEIIVNSENIYDLTKQNRHYNISVEDVIRTNSSPNAFQLTRNVPLNKTDYVITKIKLDSNSDWNDDTVASGIVYAYYRSILDSVPYKMG